MTNVFCMLQLLPIPSQNMNRSTQSIIKTWKDSGQPSTFRTKCGRKKFSRSRERRSLKRLLKRNRKTSTLELTAIFNTGHRGISTRPMRRELKGMELNSCRATRKPFVSAINRKNSPNLLSSIKMGMLSSREMSCGLRSQDLAYSRTMGATGLEGKHTKR
ncbi:hypothetical protein AVEN_144575-1 [Araneus ventricosus]|uniref:Transposase Tc1-like domain-containing protein n=1 Tax=Araneus ventricosus TaxID=182803 RepID=A0A4Y2BYZ0_ARAVE|nr:hypothetical protein AVEN_144575-1 [Araneus ventricosus]